jgi:hypothetical protein
LINIHAWQERNDDAWEADQQLLNEQLTHLEMDQQQLMETLGMQLRTISENINSFLHIQMPINRT